MGYSFAKYWTRTLVPVRFGATGTFTATASAQAGTVTAIASLPQYTRRTEITGGNVVIATAPVLTGASLAFKNGTSTFATATIGTNTAGVVVALSMTVANEIFASGGKPTVDLIGTSTASAAQVGGVYDVYFETVERYSATDATA